MARKARARAETGSELAELPPAAAVRVFEPHPRREPTPPPEEPAKVETFSPAPEVDPDDT